MASHSSDRIERWPALPFEAWAETAETLHLWTQIVGKIRLVQSPWINHSWHATLYVSARGLTTLAIPHGERSFQIDLDFIDHRVVISTCDGDVRWLPLEPNTTAEFYASLMQALRELDLPVKIHARPNEVETAIPFAEDREHSSYDADAAQRFWRALVQIDRVFKRFRAGFIGKCSPVHFFWGSFDLAVTRFSGRVAPEHPGGFPNMPDRITREAYSHEVSSAGFWPGSAAVPAVFYSYAYPTPAGFDAAPVHPQAAVWNRELGEFVLPYEQVRTAVAPEAALMAFLESTYAAAADAAAWDRKALERRVSP
jgi:Family of unknown function (DUF5996)